MDALKRYLEIRSPAQPGAVDPAEADARRAALTADMDADYRRLRARGYSANAAIRRILSDVGPRLDALERSADPARAEAAVRRFLVRRRQSAHRLGGGTALCILSILPLLILSGLFVPRIGTGAAVLFGMAALLALLGYGLSILTRENAYMDRAEPIEHIAMILTPLTRRWLRTDARARRTVWTVQTGILVTALIALIVLLRRVRTGGLPGTPHPLLMAYVAVIVLIALIAGLAVSLGVEGTAYARLLHREERLAGRRTSLRTELTRLLRRI